jgi:hypothetical protein
VSAGRKVYLAVAVSLIPLGILGALGCFCPQPVPLVYLGLWMVVGFAWTRVAYLVAHVVTGAAYVVAQIVVFTSGAGSAVNFGNWYAHSIRMGLVAAGLTGLVAFGTAFSAERRRTVPD